MAPSTDTVRAAKPQHSARRTPIPLTALFPIFFAGVLLSHLTLLRLPYFWDEAGYYIPAAWDLFRTGTLIPVTTASNAHPPLPSILLAAWWHVTTFTPLATRVFVSLVSASALLAVFRIARNLLPPRAAIAVTLLTALYPIWFAQSTLAHADIFAAAFTLWALSFYLEQSGAPNPGAPGSTQLHRVEPGVIPSNNRTQERGAPHLASEMWGTSKSPLLTALLFSLAALSKETAIITPIALALYELAHAFRNRTHPTQIAALVFPTIPLAAWYAYHRHRTGFTFGNPEFLRYNATANLDPHRIALCLYHRLLHLTLHMNMLVPTLCTIAVLFMPAIATRTRLPRRTLHAIAVILLANWVAFSILGGALLTRYLLPMYPLILLVCVAQWQLRLRRWLPLAALSAAAFLCAIWINPPYAFAPEDNLTYRDMIVLHQRAVSLIAQKWPQATVLTAWPATSELSRPEIGYTSTPIKVAPIQNFTTAELEKAAATPGDYDTALIFSTKWAPPPGHTDIAHRNAPADGRYFDFHEDARPTEAAAILHGDLVWQQSLHGEWVAILRFPRIQNAALNTPR